MKEDMDTGKIVETLAEKLQSLSQDVVAAALFGSWAKGAAREESDVDLLVVSERVHPKRRKRVQDIIRLKRALSSGFPLDVLLVTRKECRENFKNHNPLFLDIACEGIILFDPEGFLKTLVEETQTYIRTRGLVRLPDGWQFPVRFREAVPLSQVTNRDFARAMLLDGQRDLASGIALTLEGYFDKAVYHFEQAVEKAIKSVLIAFGKFKKSHFVSQDLREIARHQDLDREWQEKLITMADIGEAIEPEVTLSRYPALNEGRLFIPSEEYTIEDAQKAQKQAEVVLRTAEEFFTWWFQEPLKKS